MYKRMTVFVLLVVLALAALLPGTGITGAQSDGDVVSITIVDTSDEHGWMQPFVPFGSDATFGGAVNLYGWLLADDDYDPETTLLVSSGDNWTGPSISTWFEGEPMVEAFNYMGYDLTVIGNHEFDFGRDVLAQRIAESDYPYLGANVRDAASGDLADFVQPYAIFDVAGVNVGVIGLATIDTPATTHPRNISDLDFTGYVETLEMYVPQMRDEGAEIIVVVAHECPTELEILAGEVGDMVDAMFGGHCHMLSAEMVGDVSVMGPGWAWRSYAELTIDYNTATGTIESMDQALVEVTFLTDEGSPVAPDAGLAALVDEWQARTDDVLAQEIGFTADIVSGWPLANAITDSWLWAYPNADLSLTNFGGIRQDVDGGAISVADIVGVLPFENRIYDVAITGAELIANLECCAGAPGGFSYDMVDGAIEVTLFDGDFDPDAVYHVLINDFMFFGGDGYLFGEQDPAGYDTGIQWRQPVIDWILSLETTEDDPLQNYLDPAPRAPVFD